jgi:Mg-chelatase subunit ChlD
LKQSSNEGSKKKPAAHNKDHCPSALTGINGGSHKRSNSIGNASPPKPVKRVKTEPSKRIKAWRSIPQLNEDKSVLSKTTAKSPTSDLIDPTRPSTLKSKPPGNDKSQDYSPVVTSNQNDPSSHVIFALDCSGSMREKDVKSGNGYISRWDAVFKCVDSLIDEQLNQIGSEADARCFVSVLIFNTESKVLLKRMSLDGDGANIKTTLNDAHRRERPRLGTSFTAGFKAAYTLAASGPKSEKLCVVFLTDGRPGDLQAKPPNSDEDMQEL